MSKTRKNIVNFVPAPTLIGIHPNPGPTRGQEWTEEEKYRVIVRWKYDRKSIHAIAKEMNSDRTTVRRLIQKYEETGSVKRRSGQGRKRKLTKTDERKMRKKALTGQKATEIARDYNRKQESKGDSHSSVSARTVRRTLKTTGLAYLAVTPRQALTQAQIAARLAYARGRLDDDWTPVLFVDEKTFVIGASEDKAWQDPKNRKTRPKLIHPPKIQVWGGIGHYFKTKLYFFEENLTAKLYKQILNKRLPPYYSSDCPSHKRGSWILLQDNDPKHKSQLVTDLLEEITPDRIPDHPAYSPDFNVMEDAWASLDREIKKQRITTIPQLKRALTKAWNNLDWDIMLKSVASMGRRLQQCIDRRGERTDY